MEHANQPSITVDHVIRATCEICNVSDALLKGPSRLPSIVLCRQMAMTITRSATRTSLIDVGESFGRTHAGVHHAVDNIRAQAAINPHVATLLVQIEARARALAGASACTATVTKIIAAAHKAPARAPVPAVLPQLVLRPEKRAELARLKRKGWSVGGLMKRYGITIEQLIAELKAEDATLAAALAA